MTQSQDNIKAIRKVLGVIKETELEYKLEPGSIIEAIAMVRNQNKPVFKKSNIQQSLDRATQ